jgi:hypothetical protein
VRSTNESLLASYLSELIVGRDVINADIVMNLPLLDHLASFDVHAEQ